MKYALVLSGGGMKGAYELGAIEALVKYGIKFDFIAGTSVGALNGSLLAQNKLVELQGFWEKVEANGYSEIWESWLVKEVNGALAVKAGGIGEVLLTGKLKTLTGLGNLGPLRDKLTAITKKADFKVPFRCGITSLTSGDYFSIDPTVCNTDADIVNALVASATMPVVWNPVGSVAIDGVVYSQLVDGGVQSITPIKEAIDYINADGGKWTIIIVTCSTSKAEPHTENYGLLGVAGRALEMMLNQIFQSDLDKFTMLNNLIKENGALGKYKFVPNYIVQPSTNIGSTLDSRKESLIFRRSLGFSDTLKQFTNNTVQLEI